MEHVSKTKKVIISMIINKRIINKSLKRALYTFVFLFIISVIRVILLGPVGNRTPGAAAPHYHIATWQELYEELDYNIGGSILGSVIVFLISLPELSDKERHRIELEKQDKEKVNKQESKENTPENENLSDSQYKS